MKPELAKDSWSNYRRALIEKDWEAFDEMASKARMTPMPEPIRPSQIRWRAGYSPSS